MTTTVKLYERTEAMRYLDTLIAESEGELTPEMEQLLTEAEADFDAKAVAVAAVIREQEALAAAIKEEEQRMAARRKSAEGTAQRLRNYLTFQMQEARRDKIETPLFKIALRENPPTVAATADANEFGRLEEGDPRAVLSGATKWIAPVEGRFEWDKAELKKLAKTHPDLVDTVARIERGVRVEIK